MKQLKQMSFVYLVLIMFSILSFYPTKVYDCFIEYDRLKQYYSWLTPPRFMIIYKYSKENGLFLDNVCALIEEESAGDPYAVSIAYARGLMQVMSFHHNGHPNELFDEELNVMLGTKYFKWCMQYSKGNLRKAIMCYNAGPGMTENRYRNNRYRNAIVAHSKHTSEMISDYDKTIQ